MIVQVHPQQPMLHHSTLEAAVVIACIPVCLTIIAVEWEVINQVATIPVAMYLPVIKVVLLVATILAVMDKAAMVVKVVILEARAVMVEARVVMVVVREAIHLQLPAMAAKVVQAVQIPKKKKVVSSQISFPALK